MICKFSCKDDSYYRACARTPLRIRARPFVRKNCPGQSYLLSTETFPAIFQNKIYSVVRITHQAKFLGLNLR